MTIRLTRPQQQMLKSVRDAGISGFRFSLQNMTLQSLKTRGFVMTVATSASVAPSDLLWVITPDGEEELRRFGL